MQQLDSESQRHMQAWRGFARFLGLAVAGCVVTLGLMALFLL